MFNNDVMKSIIFLPMFCQITSVLSFRKSQEKLLSKVVSSSAECGSLSGLIGLAGLPFNGN